MVGKDGSTSTDNIATSGNFVNLFISFLLFILAYISNSMLVTEETLGRDENQPKQNNDYVVDATSNQDGSEGNSSTSFLDYFDLYSDFDL